MNIGFRGDANPSSASRRIYCVSRIGVPVERMDDQALLAGFGAGEPEVSVAFVRRFQGHVFAVAKAVLGDTAQAEDVAQQAFERAWRNAERYDPSKSAVRTWMTVITRNLAVDSLRARRPVSVDPADLVRLLGSPDREPEPSTIRSEAARTLRKAIQALPPEQARALVMAGIYRFTADEVATAEGIPLGTAKTRIRTGMRRLRDDLMIRDDIMIKEDER